MTTSIHKRHLELLKGRWIDPINEIVGKNNRIKNGAPSAGSIRCTAADLNLNRSPFGLRSPPQEALLVTAVRIGTSFRCFTLLSSACFSLIKGCAFRCTFERELASYFGFDSYFPTYGGVRHCGFL